MSAPTTGLREIVLTDRFDDVRLEVTVWDTPAGKVFRFRILNYDAHGDDAENWANEVEVPVEEPALLPLALALGKYVEVGS